MVWLLDLHFVVVGGVVAYSHLHCLRCAVSVCAESVRAALFLILMYRLFLCVMNCLCLCCVVSGGDVIYVCTVVILLSVVFAVSGYTID